jgi:hypothetical protein
MKAFYTLIFVLLAGTAFGQSSLPACKGSDSTKWSNCFGSWTTSNSDKYVGEFKEGKIHGQGTYTFANGNKYVGEFKDDYISGQGTKTWVDGGKHVGEWKDDLPNGQGTFTYANGNREVGEFKDGKLSGRAIKYRANGTIAESGIYKDDVLVTSQYIDPSSFTRIELGDTTKNISDNRQIDNSVTLDVAKLKCQELGFKPETEGFGKCVLQLTK